MLDEQSQPIIKRNKKADKKIGTIVMLLVTIIAVGVAGYSSYQLYKIKSPGYQQKMIEEQTKKNIKEVGRLIELPDGTPQIAIVSDVESLKKTQPFFARSKNGDRLFIYADEAILYRPSLDKIISVAPVSHEQPKSAPKQQEITTPPDITAEIPAMDHAKE